MRRSITPYLIEVTTILVQGLKKVFICACSEPLKASKFDSGSAVPFDVLHLEVRVGLEGREMADLEMDTIKVNI